MYKKYIRYIILISAILFNNIVLAYNLDVEHYPMFLEKLLYYKQNNFKVFYGGPIKRENGSVKWITSIIFEDDQHKTRAVYELAFVNCDIENARNASIYFIAASDIDIKFKNLLSKDHSIFTKLLSGQGKSNKYIVVRSVDVAMVFYPDIYISNNPIPKGCYSDHEVIKKFLSEQLYANTKDSIIAYENKHSNQIMIDNDDIVQYKPARIKVDINGQVHPLSVVVLVQKHDPWKLYYIIFKGWGNFEKIHRNNVLVRLDSGCVSGQIYNDDSCDCLEQLQGALEKLVRKSDNNSLIIHIPAHDGRGYGTAPKAETEIYKRGGKGRVHMINQKLDTVAAAKLLYGETETYDLRTFDGAVKILKSMGINSVILITDNKNKLNALKKEGIKVIREKTGTQKKSCINHLLSKKNSGAYFND